MKPISIPEAVMLFPSAQAPPDTRVDAYGIGYPADVTEGEDTKGEQWRVGLCLDCRHAQRIQSDRGSTFYRCKLSDRDSNFPKYPRLPVLHCAGYTQQVSRS